MTMIPLYYSEIDSLDYFLDYNSVSAHIEYKRKNYWLVAMTNKIWARFQHYK
jgi:hypothetical protein